MAETGLRDFPQAGRGFTGPKRPFEIDEPGPAVDPQNTAQIRDRELRVWDWLLRGVEGVEIARREGVDPAVISRIKNRVERRIIADTDSLEEGRLRTRRL